MFLAVAELRGFRAAARRLGVTPSAVSQAIRNLEQRIGAPLFSRTTRSVGLTEAGDRLLAHARPAVEMLTAGLDAASGLGGEISGRLRINVPRPSMPLLVNRLLPDFLAWEFCGFWWMPHSFGRIGLIVLAKCAFLCGAGMWLRSPGCSGIGRTAA